MKKILIITMLLITLFLACEKKESLPDSTEILAIDDSTICLTIISHGQKSVAYYRPTDKEHWNDAFDAISLGAHSYCLNDKAIEELNRKQQYVRQIEKPSYIKDK